MEFEAASLVLRSIARKVTDEFPSINVMFFAHMPGDALKMVEKRRFDVEHQIAGKAFMPRLEALAKQRDEDPLFRQDFAGMAIVREKGLLSFLDKYYALACFFIDLGQIEDEYQLQQHAYGQIYQVLQLADPPAGKLSALKKKHGGFYQPSDTHEIQIINNMLSDLFAAIAGRLNGQSNALIRMAKYRALQALSPKSGHYPEFYAFPLIYDLAKLVLKEQEGKIEHQMSLGGVTFQTAYELTRNIGEAVDVKSASSWKNFCEATQQLAWAGIEPRKILGTAIYSCEDPFIRSDAYLVSDILGMEPMLVTNFDYYNPFTDDEVNGRRHQKACMDIFEILASQIGRPSVYKNFFKRAHEQNVAFLNGRILGWCAPALKEAAEILELDYEEHNLERVKEVFKKSVQDIPWEVIKSAGIELIDKKRKAQDVIIQKIPELLGDHPDWEPIRNAMIVQ